MYKENVLHTYSGILAIKGEGSGNPLHYSCLKNSMDKGAWWLKSMESRRVRHDWVMNTLAIKKWSWVISSEMDEPRVCYTEWSKSEREIQISCINTHVWNIEKRRWWTYLHGRNGNATEKNELVDTVRKGVSGMNGESSINIYTLLCVKQTVIEKLLNNTRSPVWPSVMGWEEGRETQEGSRGGYRYNYGWFTLLIEL